MKKLLIFSGLFTVVICLMVFGQATPPPVPGAASSTYRNFYTTTSTPAVFLHITNSIEAMIVADLTHQPASAVLTNFAANGANLSINNGASLTNVPPTAIQAVVAGWSGIITNKSTTATNVEYFSNGVLTNALKNP